VELYEQIRQEYEHGAGTIRAVARKLGVHGREVRKALGSAMPAERKVPERERSKLAAAIPFIDAILEADRKAPRKQRHPAHRIWMRLRCDKPEAEVAESTVRQWRGAGGLVRRLGRVRRRGPQDVRVLLAQHGQREHLLPLAEEGFDLASLHFPEINASGWRSGILSDHGRYSRYGPIFGRRGMGGKEGRVNPSLEDQLSARDLA